MVGQRSWNCAARSVAFMEKRQPLQLIFRSVSSSSPKNDCWCVPENSELPLQGNRGVPGGDSTNGSIIVSPNENLWQFSGGPLPATLWGIRRKMRLQPGLDVTKISESTLLEVWSTSITGIDHVSSLRNGPAINPEYFREYSGACPPTGTSTINRLFVQVNRTCKQCAPQ